ncbi:hypothetical protein PR048_006106 [Dryococelus australis]|uniref:Uncharacterized protein n=1 Tax=Dryococelus australis TaxID=614101 RepID=A0ABQ9IA21_9NEOP|nr:hypothetical protein PR048_006106 [Dryococelus australis]
MVTLKLELAELRLCKKNGTGAKCIRGKESRKQFNPLDTSVTSRACCSQRNNYCLFQEFNLTCAQPTFTDRPAFQVLKVPVCLRIFWAYEAWKDQLLLTHYVPHRLYALSALLASATRCNVTLSDCAAFLGHARNGAGSLNRSPNWSNIVVGGLPAFCAKLLYLGGKRSREAAVVQWSDYSPPTKANRVRFSVGAIPRFSHVGIVPDDAVGRRISSGIFRFPALAFQWRYIPTHLASHPHRLSRSRYTHHTVIIVHYFIMSRNSLGEKFVSSLLPYVRVRMWLTSCAKWRNKEKRS